jgi:hypothetical protein
MVLNVFGKENLLDKPQIIPWNFSQILECASSSSKLVVGVVLGHGDPVDIDVHCPQPVELPVDHRPAHHLPAKHLHVLALVLGVWKVEENLLKL